MNRSQTLDELEDDRWGDAPQNASPMVARCHRLRSVPVADLTDGDLRLLVSQDIGLPFLVPEALDRLESDSLLQAHLYPGDLLVVVVRVAPEWWAEHSDLSISLERVVGRAERIVDTVNEEVLPAYRRIFGAD